VGNNPKGENVLAEAKQFIGEVRGDEQRAAEGRAEAEKAARELTLDEAVNQTMTETTGDDSKAT
jgi:hypothetical protein